MSLGIRSDNYDLGRHYGTHHLRGVFLLAEKSPCPICDQPIQYMEYTQALLGVVEWWYSCPNCGYRTGWSHGEFSTTIGEHYFTWWSHQSLAEKNIIQAAIRSLVAVKRKVRKTMHNPADWVWLPFGVFVREGVKLPGPELAHPPLNQTPILTVKMGVVDGRGIEVKLSTDGGKTIKRITHVGDFSVGWPDPPGVIWPPEQGE